jgi:hypothetical protein
MSNLTVSIQEKITLPNNNIETAINTVTIPGINQFVRRIDTIPYDFEGTGVGIISFVNSESTQTPGSFVNSDVKYIRITNLVNSDKFASINFIYISEIKAKAGDSTPSYTGSIQLEYIVVSS